MHVYSVAMKLSETLAFKNKFNTFKWEIIKTKNHSLLNRKTDCWTGQKPSIMQASVPAYLHVYRSERYKCVNTAKAGKKEKCL